jgi:hypothetical protein
MGQSGIRFSIVIFLQENLFCASSEVVSLIYPLAHELHPVDSAEIHVPQEV